ncbi:YoaK family protein [Streptomyces sp. SID4948]|uniref:YoaK family protein n=1 Tax=Streptomyces sp. SID4948 TaxID=2690287 RepID=UPI001F41FFAA|nr:YoaK family protein [Streptomyces sp. SID4948]
MSFPASLLLLTMAAGAVNAIGFVALGGVFTSVMTANMGLLGLAAGSGRAGLAGHSLVAIAGFVAGVPIGGRLAATRRGRPAGVRAALAVELVILCGITAGWASQGGRPDGTARLVLLAAAALAMGCQSGTIHVAAPAGVSTTYLTGSLTSVLRELATSGVFRARTALVVVMLPLGALFGGLAVSRAREAAPAVPAALVLAALALAWREAAPALWWRESRTDRGSRPAPGYPQPDRPL